MKILGVFLSLLIVMPLYADDGAVVKERMSCDDLTQQIDELKSLQEPTEEETDSLANLQGLYRKQCVKGNSGRRMSSRSTEVATQDALVEQETSESEVEQDVSVVEYTPEQVAQFIKEGLCADGTEPNKFGCCTDELFKDLGDSVFACCPKDGGDCFPPMK